MNSITVAASAQRKTSKPLKQPKTFTAQLRFNDLQHEPRSAIPNISNMTRHEYLHSLNATELQQLRKSIQRELFMLSHMPKIIILAVLSVLLFFLVVV